MTKALLTLRVEVADNAQVPNLHYRSLHYDSTEHNISDSSLSYSEAVSGCNTTKLSTHRGQRQLEPISIETYIAHRSNTTMSTSTKTEAMEIKPSISNKEVQDQVIDAASSDQGTPHRDMSSTSSLDGATASAAPIGIGSREGSAGTVDAAFEPSGFSSRPGSAKLRGPMSSRVGSPHLGSPHLSDSPSRTDSSRGTSPVPFTSGNPAVESTEGIIHIYREGVSGPSSSTLTSSSDPTTSSSSSAVVQSEMLCMLMVPATMMSQDLLQFVSPVESWLEHIKIVRDGSPNHYMVLLKFRNQSQTDEFYTSFNNKPYNSIEPEVCHLAYVSHLEAVKESEGGGLPVAGLTELPVCPVCLERMDESVDGILTVLCNHSFHTTCLSQWGDTSCPVCRYVQTPEPIPDNKCFECDASENLWICLICGHVGCGRYSSGHAHSHFQHTQHTYSMQLGSQRVWDYAGDNYVHRLVQSKDDGKLVQVGESEREGEEKIDSITLEYTYLLTSQLENQRRYYEEKMEQIEKQALKQVSDSESQSRAVLEECNRLEAKLQQSTKLCATHERRANQLQSKLDKSKQAVNDEQEISRSLLQNQGGWQDKVTVLEAKLEEKSREIDDLREQLRDIMFFLEAQQKLANTNLATQEEIQQGQLVVNENEGGATGDARGSGGRRSGGAERKNRKKAR